MTPLDQSFVRAQFPALTASAYPDHIHFDNAGGSYACVQVIDRLTRFYRETKVQPYGQAPATARGGAEMDEARGRLAALMNTTAESVSFGPSTTQNTYVLAQTFAQRYAGGDHAIIVTNQDHEANTGPWRRLAARGIEVRIWEVDRDTGALDPGQLSHLLDDRVRLVAFPHCSNILGKLNPVADWCATVRAAGALSCVDGVSAAPHGLPDIAALGADFYLFSTYKTYGPHQGIMVSAPEVVRALPNQGHSFNEGHVTARLTPAGPDHAQVAACAGIADYIEALASHHGIDGAKAAQGRAVAEAQRGQEATLLAPLLDYLRGRNDIRLLGPSDSDQKVGTVAIVTPRPGAEVEAALVPHGLQTSGGSFYAPRLLEAMGVDPSHGVLRMSFTHYTSPQEIDQLIRGLDAVL